MPTSPSAPFVSSAAPCKGPGCFPGPCSPPRAALLPETSLLLCTAWLGVRSPLGLPPAWLEASPALAATPAPAKSAANQPKGQRRGGGGGGGRTKSCAGSPLQPGRCAVSQRWAGRPWRPPERREPPW